MGGRTLEAGVDELPRPLSFLDLRANVTTGAWDQIRLAAKFFTARATGVAREVFIESPRAVWDAEDPVTYTLDRTRRSTEVRLEMAAWAIEQEMVPPDASPPLPTYQRYV